MNQPQVPTWDEILRLMQRIEDDGPEEDGRTVWTTYVCCEFAKRAPEGTIAFTGYLADFVWCYQEEEDDTQSYEGLMLAGECEWTPTTDAFWEDFVKLADLSADRRIFIGHLRQRDGGGSLSDESSTLTQA
ncbi:MAG: hypothetical protein FJ293_12890, partial [Planctomycetes bacterium]|nr:hypothetical protein [Planctomycetota bacterium]